MLALSIACTAAAAVWAYLVLGHGGYWRTGQRLPARPRPCRASRPRPPPQPGRVAGRGGRHPGPQ